MRTFEGAPSTWTALMDDRVKKRETGVPWHVDEKLKTYDFCQAHGLPTPQVYRVFKTPAEITLDGLPDKFVLKPTVLHSTKGVLLLIRNPDGGYRDLLQKRTWTLEKIIAEEELWLAKTEFEGTPRLIIEEWVRDENLPADAIPYDYKVYVNGDRPQMVFQYDRNARPFKAAWFDGGFEPLNLKESVVLGEKMALGEHMRPACWRELLDLASRASVALRTPFVSVDCYASGRGPLVGEFTLAPGGPYYGLYRFTESFDRKLGQAWEAAATALRDTATGL